MTPPAPQGPFLYDDAPEPLHTGPGRRRNRLLLAVFTATAVLAVASALALPLVRGSAGEQAREAAGVFVAALAAGDPETAYQLLCADERARLTPEQMVAEYGRAGTARVLGSAATELHGDPAQAVTVRWSGDERTMRLLVVNESGPHVCGAGSAG